MAQAGPVFVCHASGDSELALGTVAALEDAGVDCWIAPRDVPAGAVWIDSILAAITASRCLLLISTERAESSPHVLRELEQAVHLRLPIVVLRTEPGEPAPRHRYLIGLSQRASRPEELPAAVLRASTEAVTARRRSQRGLVVAALLVVAIVTSALVVGAQTWWGGGFGGAATADGPVELAEDSNARFGFRYSYPVVWTRADPFNGDGNTYRDPRLDAHVELSVYGSHANADAHRDSLEAIMLGYESDYELIDSRPAGLHLWESSTSADGQLVETSRQIPGHRILLRTTNPDGQEVVEFHQMALAPGRTISIHATLPAELLPQYQDVLNRVAASVRALSKWDDGG
jgi:TIR domain